MILRVVALHQYVILEHVWNVHMLHTARIQHQATVKYQGVHQTLVDLETHRQEPRVLCRHRDNVMIQEFVFQDVRMSVHLQDSFVKMAQQEQNV